MELDTVVHGSTRLARSASSSRSAKFTKFANTRSKIRAFQATNRLGKREAIRKQRVQMETQVASKPCRSALRPGEDRQRYF